MKEHPIHPKKEARSEKFRRSNENFEKLIRNSFDMFVLLDAEGVQRYVSKSCEKILGYSPEELTNISVIDMMIHPDDQCKAKKGFEDIINHSKHGGTQYRHRHKNGHWVYLEAFGNNQLQNPAIQGVILNVRDITERKKAEESLQKSKADLSELIATKDRFFSILGHDLKNPLSGIMGFSELLIDELKQKNYDDALELAEMIQHSSKRVMDLLNNLLAWAQSQTGNTRYNPETFNLAAEVEKNMDLLEDFSHQKSITLTNQVPENTNIYADRSMINLVLRNLMNNGIKFTPKGGQIVVKARVNTHDITISVTDNGIGINKKDMDQLFSIDKGKSSRGTYNETGTGLGLLLCKNVVEAHGGKIWVESKPGKGSTFYVTIPQKTNHH